IGDITAGIANAAIAVEGEQVVYASSGTEKQLAAAAMSIGGNGDGQRTHQMRSDSQQRGPFTARSTQARYIRMLQIPDAAMDHLETFGRRAAAEVIALQQHGAQSPQGSVARRRGPEGTAADDEQVVFALGQGRG